jgi:hypothetical protein
VPDSLHGENASMTFQAWDQTSGTASTNSTRNTADPTTNGGTTAFSTGTAIATLVVSDVNDAPVNSVPGSQTTAYNTSITFNTANSNLIAFSDVDASSGTVRAAIAATNGVLTLSTTSGLSFVAGDGTDDATITVEGTITNINAALNGLVFTPTTDYSGSAASVQLTSNDLGLTGSGGAMTAISSIDITVNPPAAPVVTNVDSTSADGIYNAGDHISVTVAFDQSVTVTGTPLLLLETGPTDRNATYVSGSGTNTLTFDYAVQPGDVSSDLDYTSTTSLSQNGGTIRNATNSDAVLTLSSPGAAGSLGANATIAIDATAPAVTSIDSTSADGYYNAGDHVTVTVAFDDSVTVTGSPQLLLETGSTDRNATYVSGSGTNTLTFDYLAQPGDMSSDLDYTSTSSLSLNGGTIRDAASNDALLTLSSPGAAGSLGANAAIVIDTTAPAVTSVDVPSAGTYGTGDSLEFTVHFDEPVTVAGGTPSIPLTIGSTTVQAQYVSGGSTTSDVRAQYVSASTTNDLLFRYIVQPGDTDTDGITLGAAIVLNGSTIQDSATNDALLVLNSVGSTSDINVDASAAAAVPTLSTFALFAIAGMLMAIGVKMR